MKVCPLVLRSGVNGLEILLFKHPLAGVQLVKGTLEFSDCSIESAALRELAEESGIHDVRFAGYLGLWESGYQNQLWHFVLCECGFLPCHWIFHTLDDGGHDFEFFWHDLREPVRFKCHDVFMRAIDYVKAVCL
ncbi:NUDIX domain-containing protein [Photobacterium galatheae]|uniref:DNA mismatch repair protein MutT n=1 Tax=Photobacterium galatheae TaxID=1654360 RepID=A0A066RSX7_9GAMM|nr:DNA mismatch repair protein MutT [Photobacterium galatheae]MCM0147049.1 NUDIX domain-containing protein [Photobacterium galatheae]